MENKCIDSISIYSQISSLSKYFFTISAIVISFLLMEPIAFVAANPRGFIVIVLWILLVFYLFKLLELTNFGRKLEVFTDADSATSSLESEF